MKEIEKKYLAAYFLTLLDRVDEHMRIKQGYAFVSRWAEWRFRYAEFYVPGTEHKTGWTTALKLGNGFLRREYEWSIPAWVAKLFSPLVPHWLAKTRYDKDGWSVDIFHGDLQGLVLAEAEVSHEGEEFPPVPQGLTLVREVTEARTYANKNLGRLTPTESQALASAAREEREEHLFSVVSSVSQRYAASALRSDYYSTVSFEVPEGVGVWMPTLRKAA